MSSVRACTALVFATSVSNFGKEPLLRDKRPGASFLRGANAPSCNLDPARGDLERAEGLGGGLDVARRHPHGRSLGVTAACTGTGGTAPDGRHVLEGFGVQEADRGVVARGDGEVIEHGIAEVGGGVGGLEERETYKT